MRRPLRSGWEGWTNERVYCWGLPRCHGRQITAAHPSHRWRRSPHVLTGKSLWRVRSMQRAALGYLTTVQKPLRLQLKMATVEEKPRLPLWVCCFFVLFFGKTADALVLPCAHGQTADTQYISQLQYKLQRAPYRTCSRFAFCASCVAGTTDDGLTRERKTERRWQDALGEHASTPTARREKWDAARGSSAHNRWRDRCCAPLHRVFFFKKNYFFFARLKKKTGEIMSPPPKSTWAQLAKTRSRYGVEMRKEEMEEEEMKCWWGGVIFGLILKAHCVTFKRNLLPGNAIKKKNL